MTQQVWWYATRSAGLLTWVAATASVALGLLLASRALGRRPTGAWLLDLHRFVGGLTVVFLAIHLVTLWADSYVQFGWAELFVPGASAWRPGAVAWGVVAAWILAAIELSSLVKDRLPRRLWHGVHLLAFPVAIMGTIHAWQAGSDVRNVLALALAGVVGAGVVVLTLQRLRIRTTTAAAREQRLAVLAAAREGLERLDPGPAAAPVVMPPPGAKRAAPAAVPSPLPVAAPAAQSPAPVAARVAAPAGRPTADTVHPSRPTVPTPPAPAGRPVAAPVAPPRPLPPRPARPAPAPLTPASVDRLTPPAASPSVLTRLRPASPAGTAPAGEGPQRRATGPQPLPRRHPVPGGAATAPPRPVPTPAP